MGKLIVIACGVLFRELSMLAAESTQIIDTVFLEQGLHNEPDKLRSEVQRQIDAVEAALPDDPAALEGTAILLGYGLCSNGIVGLKSTKVPLVIARGHDCITLLLGSKERYKEYFDAHSGTYWYSSGWIERSLQPGKERYEKIYQGYVEKYGEDNAQYLMEMEQNWFKEYSWATYIDWGHPLGEAYRAYTKECAEFLHWNYDELKGDPSLLRDMLEGRWDSDKFQVVRPGHTVAAAYNSAAIIDEGV